ncbi:MAG: hypothetical protein IPL97_08370 [Niastella sp.]|nr:hypothetical protein [Niastella sp.]
MIEPIPYFYDSINRNAIVVKPKQPLFDWINSIYPDEPVNATDEGIVYLIKEKHSNEAIEKWLKKNFDNIFQNELNNWHTDEKDWVQKRTYKLFTEWFDIEIHSMILDLEETGITKD